MTAISKTTYDFLSQISKNNNREWYHTNKDFYKEAKADFEEFTDAVINEMRKSTDLGNITAKDCTFRIQRDVRFSKDKTPYNSHMSAYIGPQGKKTKGAGFYFRIKPDGDSVIGGGIWHAEAPILKNIRQEIDYCAEDFHKIIDSKKFNACFGELDGDTLKRPPKGYEADNPEIKYIKMKQWLASEIVPKKDYMGKDFLKHVVATHKTVLPFLDFMNRAFE